MNDRGGAGYTILEVLLFIAVSSMMFVAAMTAMSGRQAQVEFAQSVREFEGKIQDLANDVNTGYFPKLPTIACNGSTTPVTLNFSETVAQTIGSSNDCLFVGKVLHFMQDVNSNGSIDEEERKQVVTYGLVGNRYYSPTGSVDDRVLADTLAEVRPVAVASSLAPDIADTYTLKFGVKVTKVYEVLGASEEQYSALLFLNNFAGSSTSSSVNSSQTVQAGGIRGFNDAQSESNLITAMGGVHTTVNLVSSPKLIICLEDERGKKASLQIGQQGSSGTVLKIDDYETGCN